MRATLFSLLLASFAGCGEEREIREWRPSDHGPPGDSPTQVASPTQGDTSRPEENDPNADELFARFCEECHDRDGRGRTVQGVAVPDIRETRRTDEEIVRVLLRGGERMPSFAKKLSEADAMAILRHVRTLRRED